MYPHSQKQLELDNFTLPFGGKLNPKNRWIELAEMIPWAEIESKYIKSLENSGYGSPAKSVRVALGALIIKERQGLTDRELVDQIRENPYMQYFLGFSEFSDEPPFHPSMMVHFRKRISVEMIKEANDAVALKEAQEKQRSADDNDSDDQPPPTNKGKLLVDATCAPADITFPTDLKLLNKAREKSEEIIDILHDRFIGIKQKPRTYRKKARKNFLSIAKSKRISRSKRRKAIRKQLGYLGRNLKSIDMLVKEGSLFDLGNVEYKNLLVINEVFRQQKWMYDNKEHKINDRIVSISQPHVRPIKRGKAGASTEFGAKLSASLVNGYCFLDRMDWDNYNESLDLIGQIESYKERFGCYPSSVHADKIYRNRNNIAFCKKKGIRMSGPGLGRPPKDLSKRMFTQEQCRKDEIDRIPIEGKFGQGKRRFSLSKIMCKLARTSETAIAMIFLVMNLEKRLRAFIFDFFILELWCITGETEAEDMVLPLNGC